MPKSTPICKNCRWYKVKLSDWLLFGAKAPKYALCKRPNSRQSDRYGSDILQITDAKPSKYGINAVYNAGLIDGRLHGQKPEAVPFRFCSTEREDWAYLDVCGGEGKYFEPKRPASLPVSVPTTSASDEGNETV